MFRDPSAFGRRMTRNKTMEFITIQKNISDSPRKLRLVASMVRKMDPYAALDVLQFTTNAAARPLAQAIKTVIANAGSKDGLSFKSIEVNEGMKMKRYRVGTAGRGRGRPYKKKTSHIKIVLTDEVKVKESKAAKETKVQEIKDKVAEVVDRKEEKKEETK
jgi:large subunit ribosomal protein L22